MSCVYLVLGVAILSSDILLLPVNSLVRTCFGILLVVYGSFRIYTLVKNSKSDEAN